MILLIDVGNSNIVIAPTLDNKILKTFRIRTDVRKTSDEYYNHICNLVDLSKIKNVIIASVVPIITSALNKLFMTHINITPVILGNNVKTGIMIKADDPKSVGTDLICDCVGAMNICNESLVVDLGTATKYIYVKDNVFMGVAISPGVSLSMNALVSGAALLPHIELVTPKKVLGNNTITAMQSGIIYGFASLVDGMINRIKKEIGNPNLKILATGGLSSLITPLCENKIDVEPNLVLEGLLTIYNKNK